MLFVPFTCNDAKTESKQFFNELLTPFIQKITSLWHIRWFALKKNYSRCCSPSSLLISFHFLVLFKTVCIDKTLSICFPVSLPSALPHTIYKAHCLAMIIFGFILLCMHIQIIIQRLSYIQKSQKSLYGKKLNFCVLFIVKHKYNNLYVAYVK